MSSKIHVEGVMHRSTITVAGPRAAGYALIKLTPHAAEAETSFLPVNVALVLDVSGSMYEDDGIGVSRLQRVKEAALVAIAKLRPDDLLALVAFAHDARLALPPTRLADRAAVEDVIQRIDTLDIDPGGTAMDEGLALGLEEVEENAGGRMVSQVLVLTDGETPAEEHCRQLARRAAEKRIRVTSIGIGTEWNGPLLKDLAQISGGRWCYIDVQQPQEIERIFAEEFNHLAATAFANVELHFRPVKDVRMKRVLQVVPEIKELRLAEAEERHLVGALGSLEKDRARRYILEMSLPPRPDGKYIVLQMEVTYDMGDGQPQTSGLIPFEIQYAAGGRGYVNAEVAKHIDEVQVFELNNNLQKALADKNTPEAQRLAETIAKKGSLMGPRGAKKTGLAKQLLDELQASGQVSKKTQLAVDDAARLAEEPPVP
jgi:Mg-chelatase subunit ChlD